MTAPRVDSYQFGRIVVDGQTYTDDIILLPDRVVPGWWRERGHQLSIDDLEVVLDAQPQVLVIGTGAHGVMKVPHGTRRAVEEAGMELKIADTDDACQTYNEWRNKQPTAGAFHLTC
jgi:hypothetical protein